MAIIYLSSTYEDLKDYRRAVYEILRKAGHEVTGMEDYVSTDQRPVDKCLTDVERADIYVGLFAFRYGCVPPPDHQNGQNLSNTELEYRHAETLGKPRLTFVAKDDVKIPLKHVDAMTGDGDRGERIKALREHLLRQRLNSLFSNQDELSALVLAAVVRYLDEHSLSLTGMSQKLSNPTPITWNDQDNELCKTYLEFIRDTNNRVEIPLSENSEVFLDDIYVALRGRIYEMFNPPVANPALSDTEREALDSGSARALTHGELESLRHELSGKPDLLSKSNRTPHDVDERNKVKFFQNETDRTLTLGEAFRTQRRLVILGEPGSGKTTLLRWLALILAVYHGREGERITIPSGRINPEIMDEAQTDDLGLKRIPIFIRLTSFNQWRTFPGEGSGPKSLHNYIGYHLASAEGAKPLLERALPIDRVHQWLTEQITVVRQTVLLLDGLDEINDFAERNEVINEVDRYLDSIYLKERTPKLSSSEALQKDLPVESGGNQVIITSRLAGYDTKIFTTRATHLAIEQMSPKSIERFCHNYVRQARLTGVPPLERDAIKLQVEQEAGLFYEKVRDLQKNQRYDLTATPMQLKLLADLYLSTHGDLPRQRTKLYKAIITELLIQWDQRLDETSSAHHHDAILRVLSQLAAQMLDKPNAGYIRVTDLESALITEGIEAEQVTRILELAREGKGLLPEVEPGVFKFFHRTVQEYLAGKWLLSQDNLATTMLSYIKSVRWREALLMALGQQALVSLSKLEQVINQLLAAPHTEHGNTPILLVGSALRDFPSLSPLIINNLANAIIQAYKDLGPNERDATQRTQLEEAFSQLCRECGSDQKTNAQQLKDFALSVLALPPSQHNRLQALACVRLLKKVRHYFEDLVPAIEQLLVLDEETLSWPVDSALSDIASTSPEYLPLTKGSLLYAVTIENPDWQLIIEQDPAWRALCLMLYGGLDTSIPEQLEANRTKLVEVSLKLQQNSKWPNGPNVRQLRNEELDALRTALETEQTILQTERNSLEASRNSFSARRFHRDSALITPFVIQALEEGRSAASLVQTLVAVYRDQTLTLVQRAEVVVALFALGQPITAYLKAEAKLQMEVLAIFRRVTRSLSPAIQTTAKSSFKALQNLATQIPEMVWLTLISEIVEINQLYGGPPLTFIDLVCQSTAHSQTQLLAEQWQFFLTNTNDDRLYNMAVALDTVGGRLAPNSLSLAQAFCRAYYATTQYGQGHFAWVNDKLAPKPRSNRQTYFMALEAIRAIPQPLQFVRGWAIGMLAPGLLKDHLLTCEAVKIARSLVPDQFNSRADAFQALGFSSEGGLSLESENKVVAESDKTLQNELPMGWQAVVAESENLEKLYSSSPTGPLNGAVLDKLFIDEAAIKSGDASNEPENILPILKTLAQANDLENCVLFFGRLASYAPKSVAEVVLCMALRLVPLINDLEIKVRLLNGLAPSAHCFPEASALLDRTLDHLPAERDRRKASGYLGVYLEQEQENLTQLTLRDPQSDFAPLILGARIYNVKRSLGHIDHIDERWANLARQYTDLTNLAQSTRASSGRALEKLAQSNMTCLTRQAAMSMEVIRNHPGNGFLTALKQVEAPSPDTLPILRGWQSTQDNPIRSYCSLLLAELGVISRLTVGDLVELLATSSDDRLRYRIANVLYVPSGRREPKIRVSTLGSDSLEALAKKTKEPRNVATRLSVKWSFEHIIHDDGKALQTWIHQLDTQGERIASAAKLILSSINEIDQLDPRAIIRAVLAGMCGSLATRQALSRSLCILLARDRLPDSHWQDVRALISKTHGECLGAIPAIEDLCMELAQALNAHAATKGKPQQFSAAFKEKARPLHTWATKPPEQLKVSLARIGENLLAGPRFTQRIATAAKLMNTSAVMKLMLEMLELPEICSPSPQDDLYHFASELLSLLAASVEAYPDLFDGVLNDKANHRLCASLATNLPLIAQTHSTFTGRQSALVLLGYLRKVTPEVCMALTAAMHDVPQVQYIALASIERYREIDGKLISQLAPMLSAESAVTAYMGARLLYYLAQNEYLESERRDSVIKVLRAAALQPKNQRDVYVFEESSGTGNCQIRHVGRLDQQLLRIVDELTGTAHFSKPTSYI